MNLQGRHWELTVGTIRISPGDASAGERPLTVRFDVSKSLDREPNKASIRICNLSPSHREALEQADEPLVQLVAGYTHGDLHDVIFMGDARDVTSAQEETEIWTTIESEDGGHSYRTSRITSSFDAGVSLATVIAACVTALGVGAGNSRSVAEGAELAAGGTVFPDGLALEGPAWRSLDMVCRSARLRWSVQNGVLQLRPRRRAAMTRAIRLSSQTGLIGSPTRSSRDARSGRVTVEARSLLMPGLFPGRVVAVESVAVEGNWLCQSVRYIGDSTATDWYAALTLQDYES